MKRLAVPAAALIVAAAVLWLRSAPSPPPPPAPSTPPPAEPAAPPATAPAPSPAAPPYPAAVKRWHAAVRNRDRQGVLDAQAELHSARAEMDPLLRRLAAEDPDPRIRASTTTLLAGFRPPPPEAFFLERLADPEEAPRESALAALERHGGAGALPAVERAAASDPSPRLRGLAARCATAIRSR